MDDEMLIECVRQHVELYDISDKRYVGGAHKQRIWKEISQYLGHSAITCKTRWNNIRDNYRKSLKKRVARSGLTGQPKNMRYRYENQLTFLLPFIKERDPNHSGPIREGDEVPPTAEETPPVRRDDDRDLQTRPAGNPEVTEDAANRSYGEELTARNEQPKREVLIEDDSLFIPELTSTNDPAESNDLGLQIASSLSHSVDAFLAGIAPTLKSLSPYYLNITKTKIFSIVQEVEMIQIVKRQKRYQARKRRASSSPNESGASPFSSSMYVPSMSPQ
ncbi:PREDICTED: uncharacterized protein LOC105569709 [Vollenhovia emeryi]|uniref:uncharacterized protein LOC105569709 n=1 Tax=Vollenhovia emeryi TaxID=411798 RepID=UPI0005F402B9|nr:PREDICTED: uncharacterized protein LOC105569709 [Vollenhovia emeryi]XP_011881773.1 PREDICTED: uncharacterized protein LOC105569709 [Vollenhovia emeryi]